MVRINQDSVVRLLLFRISNALSIQINGKAAVWLVDDHRGHIWL